MKEQFYIGIGEDLIVRKMGPDSLPEYGTAQVSFILGCDRWVYVGQVVSLELGTMGGERARNQGKWKCTRGCVSECLMLGAHEKKAYW